MKLKNGKFSKKKQIEFQHSSKKENAVASKTMKMHFNYSQIHRRWRSSRVRLRA
jgi:hypothetical protein